MSTLADYFNRTVDLTFFQNAPTTPRGGERRLVPSLIGDRGGTVIAGIQKLVQRYIRTLLTELGSLQYRPDDGTAFMTDARSGAWRTTADVADSFHAAQLNLIRQIRAEETDQDPLDERIASVTLVAVSIANGRVELTATLTSLAGDEHTFLAPIDSVPVERS